MTYDKIVVGVDHSLTNIGASIIVDGEPVAANNIDLTSCESQYTKFMKTKSRFEKIFRSVSNKNADEVKCIIERIRFSQGRMVKIEYIKQLSILEYYIVLMAERQSIPVYSVDVRSWKSKVVGTTDKKKNKFGIDESKWPTIEYIRNNGWEDFILKEIPEDSRRTKGIITKGGIRYEVDNDIADSICIGLYDDIDEDLKKLNIVTIK